MDSSQLHSPLVAAIYLCFTMVPKYSGNPFTFLPVGQAVGGLGLLACIAIMNGLVAHLALVITDYARFIKKETLYRLGYAFEQTI